MDPFSAEAKRFAEQCAVELKRRGLVVVTGPRSVGAQRAAIEAWCQEHLGAVLPITATKDYFMSELWDDRCVQVARNVGESVAVGG